MSSSEYYPGYFALLAYMNENTRWSYYEFLTRYHAEDLRPEELEDLKAKVDLEHSGKGLQTYWEGVIHKRKKLEVKCTHILGSLSLLNEAGKYNVEDLLSEGFSNSLPIDASSTSKHTLDSTIPASFERTKKIRNDESGQGEEYKQTKRVHFHEERSKSQKKKSFSRKKTPSNDNDEDEEALPPEDSLTFALNSSKIWTLPSGQNVGDIYAKKISENARAIKNKKRLTATEKAILRYGASRLIDLSTHMNKWFCDNDKKFIKKNFESILQVPELIGEENSFVLKVEDV
ncbi:22281_t:CDS:2 [Rhizophagus irregularis]|nr:22281_t:CDS:2 [Rhizophagus irregularis]